MTVMAEFDIAAAARHCAATGRELLPGERVYGVLTDEGGSFVRRDYAADAWPGPPAGAVAYWAGRIPSAAKPRKPTFDDAVLGELFQHLASANDPARMNFRYVVALLLMRRKRLKFEDLRRAKEADVMILRDARTGTRHEVADPRLSEDEIAAVQDEVFHALGWQ